MLSENKLGRYRRSVSAGRDFVLGTISIFRHYLIKNIVSYLKWSINDKWGFNEKEIKQQQPKSLF